MLKWSKTRLVVLSLVWVGLSSHASVVLGQQYRSLGSIRGRQFDELDGPRAPVRQTHRGFEIRTRQYTVLAQDPKHAELVAREFRKSWQYVSNLIDPITRSHRNPDFATGSILVAVGPSTVPSGVQRGTGVTQLVQVNTGTSLQPQIPKIHMAAAQSLMRAGGFERAWPAWVSQGIQSFVAQQLAPPTQGDSPARSLGDSGQRAAIVARTGREPSGPANEADGASDAVSIADAHRYVDFLLRGNDAEHTIGFLRSLRQELQSSSNAPRQPANAGRFVNAYLNERADAYRSWAAAPHRDRIKLAPKSRWYDAHRAQQESMVLALRLVKRMTNTPATSSIAPKVVSLQGKDWKTQSFAAPSAPRMSFGQVLHRFTSGPPQTILGTDGKILFSHDRQQWERMFASPIRLAQVVRGKNGTELTIPVSGGGALTGWLAKNTQGDWEANFTLTPPGKAKVFPAPESQDGRSD